MSVRAYSSASGDISETGIMYAQFRRGLTIPMLAAERTTGSFYRADSA